jgi:mRNA-degrading endonuclease YafQ of YafQ-DinJ toxin-antitoxin module
MKLTSREISLLNKLGKGHDIESVERKSDREFDLAIKGKDHQLRCGFSGWLILMAIRELTIWTSQAVAKHTDYPQMALDGDWSGVRDTSNEKLWYIFDEYVKPTA